MGDFRGALEYLAPAVEIWPEDGAYQSALGWALYKQAASDPKTAREHLARAIELAPRDAVAHFRLGMVLRALGHGRAAEDRLEQAKRLEPSAE
jgi:tetratricopeptide (TPR) repeat protein